MGISEHSQYQMGKQLSEKNTIISGNLDQESNQWMAKKNDPLLCTNMHSYDYTQERDQQYYHMCMLFIPLKTLKSDSFSPVSIVIFCKNTLLLMNKIVMTREIATVESIVDETYRGPGNVFKWNEIAWLCRMNLTQTQYFRHSHKGIQNLGVITFKCNLYNAGGRFFGTYFRKLLDMMSISTLLEPLNILSGKPASESLLLWR